MASFLRHRIPRRWIIFSLFIFSCISFYYFFSAQRIPATTRERPQAADPFSTIPAPPAVPFVLSNRDSKPSKPKDRIKALEKVYSHIAHFTAPKYRPACALLPTLARYPRFEKLQQQEPTSSKSKTIYLALNLINNQQVLPNFFHELSTLVTYLHNYRFYISILENGSSDLTPGLLVLLSQILDTLGVVYEITVRGDTDIPQKSDGRRIKELIRVRNGVMQSLYDGSAAKQIGAGGFDLVLFMNDIVWCVSDILEIIYEHIDKNAHMTCTTDWGSKVVYDRWVARTMTGLPFYLQTDLLEYFNGENAWQPPYPRPLPNDSDSRQKFLSLQPFQVFSCWNGAAVINPQAFVDDTELLSSPHGLSTTDNGIRFRMAKNDDKRVTERASECYLICVDLWLRGLGRILMVPRASVAYELSEYELFRQDGGRTQAHPIGIEQFKSRVQSSLPFVWKNEPPERVVYHDWAQWYAPERLGPWDEP